MPKHFPSLELNNFAPLIFLVAHPEPSCQHFTYNVTLNCEHLFCTAARNSDGFVCVVFPRSMGMLEVVG